MNKNNNNNNTNNRNVIILNKPFLGSWLENQNNIGHEVIDFLKTDNGKQFVFNNPWGACPDDIFVKGCTPNKKEVYEAQYLVLTSEMHNGGFYILYVIELKEKLHSLHTSKNKNVLENNQNKIKTIIDKKDIVYNGKYLYDIYKNDESLFVTFEGNSIYKANTPIYVNGLSFNFQRNKGYVKSDVYQNDYNKIITVINNALKNSDLIPFKPFFVNQNIGQYKSTFLELIGQESNEQVYTNILYSILSCQDVLLDFCLCFNKNKYFDANGTFKVYRESKVVDGRMDVCAESKNQRIIIENKVYSGLNGIKPTSNTTQLTTYYNWGKYGKLYEPLCYITVPDKRFQELKNEISKNDPCMINTYELITYSKIAGFIDQENKKGKLKQYKYNYLIDDIIAAFNKLAEMSKEALYAELFYKATL